MKRTSDQISRAETPTPSKKTRTEKKTAQLALSKALEENASLETLEKLAEADLGGLFTEDIPVAKLSVTTLNWLVPKARAAFDSGRAFATCLYILERALVAGRTDLVDALVGEHKVRFPRELHYVTLADDLPDASIRQVIGFAETKNPCLPKHFVFLHASFLAWKKELFDLLLEKVPEFGTDIKSGEILENLFVQQRPERLLSYMGHLEKAGLRVTDRQLAILESSDEYVFLDGKNRNAFLSLLKAVPVG